LKLPKEDPLKKKKKEEKKKREYWVGKKSNVLTGETGKLSTSRGGKNKGWSNVRLSEFTIRKKNPNSLSAVKTANSKGGKRGGNRGKARRIGKKRPPCPKWCSMSTLEPEK